jgi:hypothetical protein
MLLSEAELVEARQVAALSMDATIALQASTDDPLGGWDPVIGPIDPTEPPAPVWEGPGRVQAARNNINAVDAAGQSVTVRAYKIATPWDAPPLPVGARLQITAHLRDPELVGKTLTVTGTVYGDLGVERVVYADLDLTNQGG